MKLDTLGTAGFLLALLAMGGVLAFFFSLIG